MTIGDSILLGILQGITEFLPVSSSGHLAVAQKIMNVSQPGVNFEIALHLGTLLSIFVVLGKDIRDVLVSLKSKQTQRLILFVIIGTVPAAIMGLSLKSEISEASEYLPMVGVGFLVSALFLFMMSICIQHKCENEHNKNNNHRICSSGSTFRWNFSFWNDHKFC